MKLVMVYALMAPLGILLPTAVALLNENGLAGLTTNSGAHGFSEILYAYSSSWANNGQTFAGLSSNNAFFNITTAFAMMVGRFGLAIAALALAGTLARQRAREATVGTLPTDKPLFAGLTIGTIIIVGALTFFPALALGPVVEHFVLNH